MRACVRAWMDGGMDADVSMEGKWEQANWGVIRSQHVVGIGHYVPTQLYRRRAGRKRRQLCSRVLGL